MPGKTADSPESVISEHSSISKPLSEWGRSLKYVLASTALSQFGLVSKAVILHSLILYAEMNWVVKAGSFNCFKIFCLGFSCFKKPVGDWWLRSIDKVCAVASCFSERIWHQSMWWLIRLFSVARSLRQSVSCQVVSTAGGHISEWIGRQVSVFFALLLKNLNNTSSLYLMLYCLLFCGAHYLGFGHCPLLHCVGFSGLEDLTEEGICSLRVVALDGIVMLNIMNGYCTVPMESSVNTCALPLRNKVLNLILTITLLYSMQLNTVTCCCTIFTSFRWHSTLQPLWV